MSAVNEETELNDRFLVDLEKLLRKYDAEIILFQSRYGGEDSYFYIKGDGVLFYANGGVITADNCKELNSDIVI